MLSMRGEKCALVTGGSSGIGREIAKLLLRNGFKVAITGTNKAKLDMVVQEAAELSPFRFQIIPIMADFSVATNGRSAVDTAIFRLGRLDALINNAGTMIPTYGKDPKCYDTYRFIMSVNLDAAVCATMAAIPHLHKTNGQIIFISSTASTRPHEKSFAYAASKAGLSMFAKCLTVDICPEIKVNIVSPGPVRTDIFRNIQLSTDIVANLSAQSTLERRCADAEEIADVVAFLLSSAASYITGAELFVDGGYLLKSSFQTVIIDSSEQQE